MMAPHQSLLQTASRYALRSCGRMHQVAFVTASRR
jgi:hypothetical protein